MRGGANCKHVRLLPPELLQMCCGHHRPATPSWPGLGESGVNSRGVYPQRGYIVLVLFEEPILLSLLLLSMSTTVTSLDPPHPPARPFFLALTQLYMLLLSNRGNRNHLCQRGVEENQSW